MIYAAIWCLSTIILGFICFPISFATFKYLPDRGFAFSKLIGVLLLSYLLWITASAGWLPASRFTAGILLLVLLLISVLIYWRFRWKILEYLRANTLYIVSIELLFITAFVIAAIIRAYNPAIAGTEKPMDFAFFNSALRSLYFPPTDPWFSGNPINYYYFGYLATALMTKLTFTPSPVGFNLSLSLIFSLAAVASFGLVYNIIQFSGNQHIKMGKAIGFSLLAPLMLLVAGNMEAILEFARAFNVGPDSFWVWLNVRGLESAPGAGLWPPAESWWWRASRIINTLSDGRTLDYTITEFPCFSFLLGDLHPHLMALPFTILSLGVSLNILFCMEPFNLTWLRQNWLRFAVTVLTVGALGFLNSWDMPTYGLILGAVILLQVFTQQNLKVSRRWLTIIIYGIILLLGAFFLYLPFYQAIEVPLSGVLPWRGPNTRLLHYLIIWGLFLFVILSFLIKQFVKFRSSSVEKMVSAAVILLIPWLVWSAIELLLTLYSSDLPEGTVAVANKLWYTSPYLMLSILALILLIFEIETFRKNEAESRSNFFIHLLIFTALLLTLGGEYFYIIDVFNNRMNTIFKFYYQAWTLMAIATAYSLFHIKKRWQVEKPWQQWGKAAWYIGLIFLCISSFIYPVSAVWSITNGFAGPPTLDGLTYLDRTSPADAAAIRWVNKNITGTPVMLEAYGDDWTEYGRVSSSTGLPTLINWVGHETQWRGMKPQFERRQTDIDLIYKSQDTSQVISLLKDYGIEYVYFGVLEKAKYGEGDKKKFEQFMDTIYDSDGVTIFKRRS